MGGAISRKPISLKLNNHFKDIFKITQEHGEDGRGEKANLQTDRHIMCGLKGRNVIDIPENNALPGPL